MSTSKRQLPNYAIGLIAVFLVFLVFYLAFTKSLPWSHGYEVKAVVKNAQNLAKKSPVRIAGVDVGKVKDIKSLTNNKGEGQQAAVVTMEIKDNGRPIHEDAKLEIRPRLFLEGNLFVDLQPGSPSAPEAPDGFRIPIQHTSNSVQLDQVLTSLQADTRQNLQILLKELGDSFVKYGGDDGLREFFKSSAVANKSTSEVSQALLGTAPDDLSNLVVNLDRAVVALGSQPTELLNLITNLRIVTGSFAAQSQALERSIHLLPEVLDNARPALVNLNAAFPPLRAFARDALPGVRSAGPALDAATPWIFQLRRLVSKRELRALLKDLRPTIPALSRLAIKTTPFLEQTRALSSCFANVVIPWANDAVTPSLVGPTTPGQPNPPELSGIPVYKETGYGLVGLAGESRSGDANGQYIRVEAGGGQNTVVFPEGAVGSGIEKTVGITPFQLLGYEPAIASSAKPPFRPDIPCETQERPNLGSGGGATPPQQFMSRSRSSASGVDIAKVLSNAKTVQSLLAALRGSSGKGKLSLEQEIAKAFAALQNTGPSGQQIIRGEGR